MPVAKPIDHAAYARRVFPEWSVVRDESNAHKTVVRKGSVRAAFHQSGAIALEAGFNGFAVSPHGMFPQTVTAGGDGREHLSTDHSRALLRAGLRALTAQKRRFGTGFGGRFPTQL